MGGSSGFGAKIAKTFNEQDSYVWITGRNIRKLKKVINNCEKKKKIYPYAVDINNFEEVNHFFQYLKKKVKHLDIIIYCCGTNIRSNFNKISNKDFKYVFNTNFFSAFNFYQKVFPFIKNKKKISRIVNFTSIFSSRTFEKRTSYSTSKAALLMLTKNLALEWSNYNTTVNSISPGPFLTEINLPVLKDKKNYKEFCKKIPLNRFGKVDEIISSVLFLASESSSYVNGTEIIVDGGWTIK